MIFAFTFLLAGNLVACGFLLEYFANVPYSIGVVVASALVLSYTLAGGLFSDAYTAVLQTVITVVAAVALIVWVALTYGIVIPEGMGPFDLEQLTSSEAGAPINWATLIALGIGDLVAIDFMQRIFGAKSPKVAQRSCFVAAGTTAVIGTIFALVALTASSVLGLSAENGPILYTLLGEYAPPLLAVTDAAVLAKGTESFNREARVLDAFSPQIIDQPDGAEIDQVVEVLGVRGRRELDADELVRPQE